MCVSNTHFNTKNYNVKIPLQTWSGKEIEVHQLSRANIGSYELIISQDSL